MKNITVLLGLLLCLSVSSWGACRYLGVVGNNYYTNPSNCRDNPSSHLEPCKAGIPSKANCPSGYPAPFISGDVSFYCLDRGTLNCSAPITCCGTQAEADSATIAQKCATGTMVKDTVGATIFDACQNGEGLLIAFNNPITGVHNASIGYYIVTDDSADSLDEATYNHLASLACTEVSLYRGVLNGKYVYWYSTDPEPAGVVNVVRIK